MQFTRAQLGAFLLAIIAVSAYGIYWFMKRPPTLTILKPTTAIGDTLLNNEPIEIQWNYGSYDGDVNIFFVDDKSATVIETIAHAVHNIPNKDNGIEWSKNQLARVNGKKGTIKIEGKNQSAVFDMAFVIAAPPPPPPMKKRNFLAYCSFDASTLIIYTLDTTITAGECPKGSIWLDNKLVGRTNEALPPNSIKIDSRDIPNPCTGTDNANNPCTQTKTQFSTANVLIKIAGYNDLAFTPVRTHDANPGCKCADSKNIEAVVSQMDNQFRIEKKTNPVSERFESNVRLMEKINTSSDPFLKSRVLREIQSTLNNQ